MGQPAIPDPVLMPYPSRASRSPYPGPQVRFEPPSLDFSDVPLGQEVKRTVKIYNLDDKTPLEIKVSNKKTNKIYILSKIFNILFKSISSPNSYFSSTFPSPNRILPSKVGSFDVVFIPRTLGNVEQTLVIESSLGPHKLKYSLFGVGIESPYRIRPFLGARIPLNESYEPKILIYNPESAIMQITEIYSTTPKLQISIGENRSKITDSFSPTCEYYRSRKLFLRSQHCHFRQHEG